MQYLRRLLRGALSPRPSSKSRRLLLAPSLIAIAAAVTLVFAAASSESGTQSGLRAYVVPTSRGPLTPCSDVCTPDNFFRYFIYVDNTNRLTNEMGGSRETFPNAYVVSSIDEAVFVDGVHTFDLAWTPPPNVVFRSASGNWPSTVTCPASPSDPCNVVGSPAVDPGENTAVFHQGWVHAVGEPTGLYVFTFTIHGTLNGTPIDLTASLPPIQMTN